MYKNISENRGYSFNEVNVSSPVLDGTCDNCVERTTDISGNGEASFVYNSTSDWITGENRSTFSKYSDSGFNHSEDGQRIVNRTKLVVDNERSSEFRDVDLSSFCSETVSGSVASGSSVEVTNDCTRNSFTGDWIASNISGGARDRSYGHSLDSQSVYVSKNLTEEGGYNWSTISVSAPSINGSCGNCGLRNISLDAGESTTEYYNASSDWIVNESVSTTEVGQDTSVEAGVDQQTLYNQSRLRVANTRSFSFSGVDVSGKCSTTTSVAVPAGENVVTEACNNESFSGDWIRNEENTSTEYVSGNVLLGDGLDNRFTAEQGVEVTNVRSSTGLTVDLDSLIEDVPGCQLGNSSTQNVPADSVSQLTFTQSCSPGSHLNRTPVLKTETDSFYKYGIEFGFEAASNLTEEQDFRYAVKKEWADQWNSRDPTQTEVAVDGKNKDITIRETIIDGTEYIVFVIGDEHGNSSIHKGTHTASLNYYESKSPGSTSGSSGSSGGSLIGGSGGGSETVVEEVSSDKYNWTFSTITSNGDQSFQISGYPGASFEKYVVLRNTGDTNVTLDVECASVGDACDWVDLSVDRVVLNRNSFSEKTVTVSGEVPEGFSDDAPIQFSIRASDPRFNGSNSGEGVAYVDFTVTNSPVLGPALDVALKVFEGRELESPVSWGNSITIPFFLIPVSWASLVMILWSVIEWLNPLRKDIESGDWSTNLKWVATIGVFLLSYILL